MGKKDGQAKNQRQHVGAPWHRRDLYGRHGGPLWAHLSVGDDGAVAAHLSTAGGGLDALSRRETDRLRHHRAALDQTAVLPRQGGGGGGGGRPPPPRGGTPRGRLAANN